MRGSAFSGEGESEDEGRGFGFAGAGEVIGFSASWAWAVGMGLEAKWLSAESSLSELKVPGAVNSRNLDHLGSAPSVGTGSKFGNLTSQYDPLVKDQAPNQRLAY
ncbi:hypothetical protein FCV25MIE_20005 [Fagus crenata]